MNISEDSKKLLERDIEKIKSMMTLRFEDLACYETEY